jgi:hypothetical protein
MNEFELKAILIDLTSRTEALESVFIGYVRVNERRTVSCQIAISCLEEYFDTLRKKLNALPSATSVKVEAHLLQRMQSVESQLKHYREWQEYADSVEEFEDVSKFELHHRKH